MKYFLHDTNAFQDEKITALFMEFGYEGIGLFYTLLEKIGAQEKPIKTEVLKTQLHVGKRLDKCWSFMEQIGLISSNNGDTFNERILSYAEKYLIKKEKNRERISKWRDNQQDAENVTRYETVTKHVRNAGKVKESKENINISFDVFWDAYDKKIGDRKKLEKKWANLTDDDRQKIIQYIPKYKSSQPDKTYRKNPETFLNNNSWNDEIISSPKVVSIGTQVQQESQFTNSAGEKRSLIINNKFK